MARKEKLNLSVDAPLVEQFREVAKSYDNRLGMCLAAAMLQFIRSDPNVQAESIRAVFDAQLREEVDALIQAIKAGRATRPTARSRPTPKG